jgi:hypothetical protein
MNGLTKTTEIGSMNPLLRVILIIDLIGTDPKKDTTA